MMFEEIIRSEVKKQKEWIEFCESKLNKYESSVMIEFWSDEIRKHEYAIDTLNGVLNLVSLTR